MSHGLFFSLDGIDGAGKSTQVKLFCDWLTLQGHQVVACRDPGSTRLGEAVRGLLLHRRDLAIGRRGEMLLYMAARAQLVEEIILPAWESGKTIVCDRFLLANVAYQAHAGGLDVEETWMIGRAATRGLLPDLTFVLDLAVDTAWNRMQREPDRMEAQGREFLERVRSGYLVEAARQRERAIVINADRNPPAVQSEIRDATQRWLRERSTQPDVE